LPINQSHTREHRHDTIHHSVRLHQRFTGKITGWYDEPNADFDTLEEAEAGLQSLVDVCGYDADYMRIVEEEPIPPQAREYPNLMGQFFTR
jgi:hypothetical protein